MLNTNTNNDSYVISGNIFIIDGKPFVNASLYIHIIDSTFLDTYSNIIYTHTIKNLNYFNDTKHNINFRFYIEKAQINLNKNYSIEIHIDINGDNKINIGDYINMESYPLKTFIESDNNIINVKQIK